MEMLRRVYGWPHEALHLVGLWLVGRRPAGFSRTHVDLPDDLTRGEFIFVAGLPALAFGLGALLGTVGAANAATPSQALLGLAAAVVFGLGAAGTVGDIQAILLRIARD